MPKKKDRDTWTASAPWTVWKSHEWVMCYLHERKVERNRKKNVKGKEEREGEEGKRTERGSNASVALSISTRSSTEDREDPSLPAGLQRISIIPSTGYGIWGNGKAA